MAQAIKTIHLQDHGQDFLEWDVDAEGNVVACRPCQAWVWVGYVVLNDVYTLQRGDVLRIKRKDGTQTTLNYPVDRVEWIGGDGGVREGTNRTTGGWIGQP